MAHVILLSGVTEIRQTADSWQGWMQVSQPSQNLQTALWGEKLPISKFFSFWRICTYFSYKINFVLFLLSIIFLNALDNGYRAFSNVVNLSNQIFHLRNHFCLLLAGCHCVLLTKRKKSILPLQTSPIDIMPSWKSLIHFKRIRTRTSIFTADFLNTLELKDCNPFSNQKVASTLKVWAVQK